MTTRRKLKTETVAIESLHPHPRNYRSHPDDQLDHIQASILEHGQYRPIVVARDSTILAGHGVWMTLDRMHRRSVEVVRLPIKPDSAEALRLLAGDNEISRRSENDDRALADLLSEIQSGNLESLLGTGYDEHMLAALAYSTRTRDELSDFNAAEAWAGVAGIDHATRSDLPQLVITFPDADERARFGADVLGDDYVTRHSDKTAWTARWPDKNDPAMMLQTSETQWEPVE